MVPKHAGWDELFWLLLGLLILPGISRSCCCQDRQREASAKLVEAEANMAKKSYSAACQAALEAVEIAPKSVPILQRSAEILYRSGQSKKSLPVFDKVVKLSPQSEAFNWQRGIALCSCGEFTKGARQFKSHHDVNPHDVENSAWYFLCVAKTKGISAARQAVIPSAGDAREPMMSVLQMLKGKLQPEQVLQAALDNTTPGAARRRARFYADLYVGLYYDSLNKPDQAKKYLKNSLSYGDSGYMVDVARVYLADRFSEPATAK